MAINVKLEWYEPIILGPKIRFIKNLEKSIAGLPTEPGIYVFARRFGKTCIPIYVGRASKGLRLRIKQQSNNRRLIDAIRDELNGERVLMLAKIITGRGQNLETALAVAEKAHIEHSLTAGYPLVNIAGTKAQNHTIQVEGKLARSHPFPRRMLLPARRG